MLFTDPAFRRVLLWLTVLLGVWAATSRLPHVLVAPAEAQHSDLSQPIEAATADKAAVPEKEAAPLDPVEKAEAALSAPEEHKDADDAAKAGPKPAIPEINVWELMKAGGPLMWPIYGVSVIALAFAVERFLGLRRNKVMPPPLIGGLGKLAAQKGGMDLRHAYKLCQRYPSTAASVVKSMLLKAGRPHSEVEHAVTEANEREASRLYYNVRWLNLSISVAPMLGLLGTIQGMIMAFFVTANLPTGYNKTQHLAQGIYTALVTTFAGLTVAIPAAILAHALEGRILRLMGELDEFVMGLLPQLERFEGRLRVGKEQLDQPESEPLRPAPPEEVKRKPPAVRPPST